MNAKFIDIRIEEHTDHARKKITTVPVYRLKAVNKNKYNGDGSKQGKLAVTAANITE